MKITKLKLYTNQLDAQKEFYTQNLGFELIEDTSNHFTVKVGWSDLTFEKSPKEHIYHYCFLIPSNKLHEGLEWLKERVEIIDIEDGSKTQKFESWNAESFYFFDGSGNLAEFIVRYDLQNEDENDFDHRQLLCVNEIGMPTKNVEEVNNLLENSLGTKLWKGDLKRFGTNGSQQGLFLLPNYNIKEFWFPTSVKVRPEPFEVIIKNGATEYYVDYKNEMINIKVKTVS